MPPPGTLSQQAAPVALHVGQQVSAAVSQHLDQLPQPSRGTDGTWTLSVQLDPPELGKVDAVLSLGASGLSVVLAPSTPAAQQAIQQASRQIAQNIGGNVTVFVQTGAGGTGGGQQGHPGAGGQQPATWLGGDKGRTGTDVARERTQGPTYMLV
jgi:flagellar hook-length control protein FliK